MARAKKQYYIGYAREWSGGPTLAEQTARLRDFGCWNVYAGSPAAVHCPELSLALIDTCPGDYFVVVKLLCLGLSSRRLAHVLKSLQQNNIDFCALGDGIDTRGPNGALFIPTMLQMLDLKRSLRSQVTQEGLADARLQGRVGGRPAVLSDEKLAAANELIAGGQHTMAQIAKLLGVSRGSLYNSGLSAKASAQKTRVAHEERP